MGSQKVIMFPQYKYVVPIIHEYYCQNNSRPGSTILKSWEKFHLSYFVLQLTAQQNTLLPREQEWKEDKERKNTGKHKQRKKHKYVQTKQIFKSKNVF